MLDQPNFTMDYFITLNELDRVINSKLISLIGTKLFL